MDLPVRCAAVLLAVVQLLVTATVTTAGMGESSGNEYDAANTPGPFADYYDVPCSSVNSVFMM